MRAALAAHDEVLRRVIEAHGGFMYKHTGDGVCAAFSSPRSAVDAAVVAQQALELAVQTGIATGEAELRGADYFGAVLNRAARVIAGGTSAPRCLGLFHPVALVRLGSTVFCSQIRSQYSNTERRQVQPPRPIRGLKPEPRRPDRRALRKRVRRRRRATAQPRPLVCLPSA
jgi:class 3 adenylate cyclase